MPEPHSHNFREGILQSLSDIHLPDIDLSALDRRRAEVTDAIANVELPRVDLPSLDVGKAVAGVAAATHLARHRQRPRWRLLIGGMTVAGVAGWAIMRDEAIRAHVIAGASEIRKRVRSVGARLLDRGHLDRAHPGAFTAAETAPIQPPPFADGTSDDPTPHPAGLGANNDDVVVAEGSDRDA